MPQEFEEHLLSAYLDDELSADERALVEERLKTDSAARQLLEDFKRVRSLVATLPRWEASEVKAEPANGQTSPAFVEPAAPEQAENAAPPTTASQVDYSATSLAESRLRLHDRTAAVRTRRSMRWTTIVAVAAGLATLMLAAPYLFHSESPTTEIAQHTQSPAAGTAPATGQGASESIPAPVSANEQAAGQAPAGAADKALDDKPSPATTDFYLHQQLSEAGSSSRAPEESSSGASPRASRTKSLQRSGTEAPLAERDELAASAESNEKRISGGGDEKSDAVARGRAAPLGDRAAVRELQSNLFPAEPVPNAPASRAEPSAGQEPSKPAPPGRFFQQGPKQETLNYEGQAAGGQALAPPAAPPSAAALEAETLEAKTSDFGSMWADKVPRDDRRGGAPMGRPASPATASPPVKSPAVKSPAMAAPQLAAARSDAWTEAEVESAMNRVWYFVAPSEASGPAAPQPLGGSAGSGAYGFAGPTAAPGAAASTNLGLGLQPQAREQVADQTEGVKAATDEFDSKPALSKNAANAPVAGDAAVSAFDAPEAAASASKAAAGRAGAPAPAIGLARFPAGESPLVWLKRLEQERSLKPLEPARESVSEIREQESAAAGASKPRSGPIAASEPQSAGDAKTVVLFVTATEARQILQSLEAEKSEPTSAKQRAQPGTKDNAPAAAGEITAAKDTGSETLPPAWWTRPPVLSRQNIDEAKAGEDEKVILILSQVPRG